MAIYLKKGQITSAIYNIYETNDFLERKRHPRYFEEELYGVF